MGETDLISRQAAIDAIESHIRTAEEPYQLSQTEKVLNHAFDIAASCVYNLPSAQSEIIYCKDCTRYEKKNGRCNLVEGLNVATANSFCSFAERRTDADD